MFSYDSPIPKVYRLIDQQLKQKSGFNDASSAADFSRNVYILTEEQVHFPYHVENGPDLNRTGRFSCEKV